MAKATYLKDLLKHIEQNKALDGLELTPHTKYEQSPMA